MEYFEEYLPNQEQGEDNKDDIKYGKLLMRIKKMELKMKQLIDILNKIKLDKMNDEQIFIKAGKMKRYFEGNKYIQEII